MVFTCADFLSIMIYAMAVVVKLVNTPDCGSGIREFESRQSPHIVNKVLALMRTFFIFIDDSHKPNGDYRRQDR